MNRNRHIILAAALLACANLAWGADVVAETDITKFKAGDVLKADPLNANFENLRTGVNSKQDPVKNDCTGSNQSIKTIAEDGTVTCEADDGVVYSGTSPISVSGGTVSLTTCAANQIYKMVGGVWTCADDADTDTNTTYSAIANSGVQINASNQIGLISTCPLGQVLKAGVTVGTWACAADFDTNTTYTNGSGLTLAGTTFATDNTVVARKDGTSNQNFGAGTLFLDYTNKFVGINYSLPSSTTLFRVNGGVAAAETAGKVIVLEAEDGGPDTAGGNGVGGVGGTIWLYPGSGGPGLGAGAIRLGAASGGAGGPGAAGGVGSDVAINTGVGGAGSAAYAAGSGGRFFLFAGAGGANSNTGPAAAAGHGGDIQLTAGDGGAGVTAIPGKGMAGNISLFAGDAGAGSNSAGGDVYLGAGYGAGTGGAGDILLTPGTNAAGTQPGEVSVQRGDLRVAAGNVVINQIGAGIELLDPNGRCWRLGVTNTGVVSAVLC